MNSTVTLISKLENYLRLTTNREQAISANMANVDTPGYHSRDINFAGEFKKAMNLAVSQSDETGRTPQMSPVVQDVSGLMERPDGNNVSLDREGLLMSEMQLQYQIGVQLVKHQFHQMLSAINGGN